MLEGSVSVAAQIVSRLYLPFYCTNLCYCQGIVLILRREDRSQVGLFCVANS